MRKLSRRILKIWRHGLVLGGIGCLAFLGWLPATGRASSPSEPPAGSTTGAPGRLALPAGRDVSFQEVYELLRTNLAGLSEAELNRAAVQGLLSQLQPQVSVLNPESAPADKTAVNDPAITTAVYDAAYASVRIGRFGPETARQFADAHQRLASSNRLKGLVLDLRFATGEDYAAAAAVADSFFKSEQPLLDWGEGMKKSTEKSQAIGQPVIVLVNKKTSGAPEALAALLRAYDLGLVLGAKTAGHAGIAREFTLANGQRLRIAAAPLKIGDNHPLALGGLAPDIEVADNPEDEQAWINDPYKSLAKPERVAALNGNATNDTRQASTNRQNRRRINEAELVRMQRDGQTLDLETNLVNRDPAPVRPAVQDPALARALDLLKGLAVVQRNRTL
jgi:hypothetical protein